MEESNSSASGEGRLDDLGQNPQATARREIMNATRDDTQSVRIEADPAEATTVSATPRASGEASTGTGADPNDPNRRSRNLMEKYNLEAAPTSWPKRQIPPLDRVSRPIRIRVRYTCHRCKTSFGAHRECNNCQHHRCGRCERYPPKRPHREAAAEDFRPPPTLETAPETSEVAAADHVCICHECQTTMEIEIEECPNCQHTVCGMCQRIARLLSMDEANSQPIPPQHHDTERNRPPEEHRLPPDIPATNDEQAAATPQ